MWSKEQVRVAASRGRSVEGAHPRGTGTADDGVPGWALELDKVRVEVPEDRIDAERDRERGEG